MLSASVAGTSGHRCLGCRSSSLQTGFFWEMVGDNHKPVPAGVKGCRDSPCPAVCMERGQEVLLPSGDGDAKPRLGRMSVQQGGRMGIYLDGLESMNMGQNYPRELRAGERPLFCHGGGMGGTGPGQGSSHTCRQEEAAKISRWVEKGGESIKEIT